MTSAEDRVVTATRDGDVGLVVLDRPEAMNAITVELGRQLGAAFAQLAGEVRVILVRGAGGNFSVGGDFHEVKRLSADGPAALTPLFENFGQACAAIAGLPVPVVAAVEGYAMAGGFELMQACDVVLVRADAKIADNHANFGQVPGGGGSQRLPRLVGHQRALGHILSGERLSGAQAEAWGLAYRSFAPEDFEVGVAEFVASVAKKDRDVLVKIKRLVRDGLRMPLDEGLKWEMATVVEHIGGDAAAAAGIDGFTRKERA
ncbi:enoyl-CoA hydratase/isomerase family protein [Amycolatopsis echigonensis]|uniref:Enoyl-CoA hydratase/isomerase family protein n=1 Tax=Amycolatopsis echigonensis TaxID=2576905 RepID=A0A8E2B913_9PSEU|nr:enoyl-CoA hydratase/isomerase family protein [Amycolatopsis echigonensis]MBB2504932.1 enoyl-CoA hydratase/isomerase family protein [Amycolatopsis echigonensis]